MEKRKNSTLPSPVFLAFPKVGKICPGFRERMKKRVRKFAVDTERRVCDEQRNSSAEREKFSQDLLRVISGASRNRASPDPRRAIAASLAIACRKASTNSDVLSRPLNCIL
jgi:hypothetical protein